MTATPAPVITAPLADPSGPVPRQQPVTWYAVTVTISRLTTVTFDQRTISLPMLIEPELRDIQAALMMLGWTGYVVEGVTVGEVRS